MNPPACPVCGSSPRPTPYYQSPAWTILQCSRCTFAWIPDSDHAAASTGFTWSSDVVSESAKRMSLYEDRFRRIDALAPNPRTWLDVGCGGGGMLTCAAQHGFGVEGIELAPSAAIIATELGIPVHTKVLAESVSQLRHGPYGVVSYFHVLEHIRDPRAELVKAGSVLGPKGVLAIEVPYFGTLSWRVPGWKHRHNSPDHRSYFDPQSLSELLRQTGYAVIRWQKVPHYMSLGWLLFRLKLERLGRVLPRGVTDRPIRVDLNDILLVMASRA